MLHNQSEWNVIWTFSIFHCATMPKMQRIFGFQSAGIRCVCMNFWWHSTGWHDECVLHVCDCVATLMSITATLRIRRIIYRFHLDVQYNRLWRVRHSTCLWLIIWVKKGIHFSSMANIDFGVILPLWWFRAAAAAAAGTIVTATAAAALLTECSGGQ